MSDLTNTVKLDQTSPRDGVFETDITSVVTHVTTRNGREKDSSKAKPGTCILRVNNASGDYTPKAGGFAIRALQGVEVTTQAQDVFTGFVQNVYLHPSAKKQDMIVRCADWLYILSRTDISMALMRDVRSDLMIHRALDLSEVGELVTNPRFKDDLTGYSEEHGSTNTRATDVMLEGQAGLKTETSGALSGWRYTVPSGLVAGDKVTAAVYVQVAAGETAPAGNHVIRVSDDVDAVGTNTAFQSSSEWQRVEVTHTFGDAGEVAFYIDLERAAAGTDGTFRTGAVHLTLYRNAIPRTLAAGQSKFENVAPRRDKALKVIQDAADNELGGYVYVSPSGTVIFEDRCHRWRETESRVSQGMIDEAMVDLPYSEDADDRIGEVELHYQEWVLGTAGTRVWSANKVYAIPANGTLTVDIDYGALVRDPITPVANTDFFIRSQPDSDTAGADETGNVSIAFEDFGGGAQAVFTSTAGYTTHLTSFKIRGTPVKIATAGAQITYTPAGAPVVAAKLRFSYRYQSSKASVQGFAEYMGDRHAPQKERLPVSLINASDALRTEMTERAISDRVTITNDNSDYSTKVNNEYVIDAIRHELDMGKKRMRTVWSVVPADMDSAGNLWYAWRLGTGELGDARTVSTTTAIG